MNDPRGYPAPIAINIKNRAMNKYLDIDIAGQDNIGVIKLDKGVVDYNAKDSDNSKRIKRAIESKIVKALESHFDCPVKIRLTEVISTTPPIRAKTTVVIESDAQDYPEEVELSETWVY